MCHCKQIDDNDDAAKGCSSLNGFVSFTFNVRFRLPPPTSFMFAANRHINGTLMPREGRLTQASLLMFFFT